MGHIVNAKSTRIGCTTHWTDQWYCDRIYYSEYMHAMFRIRFYLYYIFTERHFDRKAMFFSHFELYRYNRSIIVEIFYYDGKWETEYEDYKIELYKLHYNMPMNKDPEIRKPFFLVSSLKFLVLFNWIFTIHGRKKFTKNFNIKWKARLIRLFRLMRLLKYSYYVKHLSYTNKYFFYTKKLNLHFIIFMLIYINIKISIGKTSLWSIPCRNTILRRIYYLAANHRIINQWVKTASLYFSFIFKLITKFNKINVFFFLTNNNCVNAKFLSRFIARKLQQGYPLKELLHPIKKELNYLLAISSMSVSSYFAIRLKKYGNFLFKKEAVKSIYKLLLTFSVYTFNKLIKNMYEKNKMFLNLDVLILLIWIFECKNNIMLNNFNYDENKSIYIDFCINYWKKKVIFICFFENKFFFKNIKYLLYPKLSKSYLLIKERKFERYFDWMILYFNVNKFSLLPLKQNKYNQKQMNSVYFFGINLSRFMKYNYLRYNYKELYQYLGINYLKSRIKIHTRGSNLMGYKMYFKGRFSRKQRAGHLWFSKGKVSLNTLSSFIDFAFFSLSLRNSTITVRVWLYKFDDIDNKYYFKLL